MTAYNNDYDFNAHSVYRECGDEKPVNIENSLREYHQKCEDYFIAASRLRFAKREDEPVSSNIWDSFELRVKRGDHSCDEAPFYFTKESWGQFCKKIAIPSNFIEELVDNPELLARAVEHLFRKKLKEPQYLLRAVKEDGKLYLRGLLYDRYTRLDNYMIVRALKERKADMEEMGLDLHNAIRINDDMLLDYVNKSAAKKLTDVGDECFSGVRIVNNDIGKGRGVTLSLYYERLVCANGMTRKIKVKDVVINKVPNVFNTIYGNRKPDWDLPDEIQMEISKVLIGGVRLLYSQAESEGLVLRQEMQALLKKKLDMASEIDIKKLIVALIKLSNIRTMPGVSLDDIYRAYQEEVTDFPGTKGTAYALFNAITRYASNRLLGNGDDPNARRRKNRLTVSGALNLSRRITRQTDLISNPRFDWDRVQRDARKVTMVQSPDI